MDRCREQAFLLREGAAFGAGKLKVVKGGQNEDFLLRTLQRPAHQCAGPAFAGEWDTPRDLGCQWIKKASQKPLDGVYTRGARRLTGKFPKMGRRCVRFKARS
jgi:hypothetical protein